MIPKDEYGTPMPYKATTKRERAEEFKHFIADALENHFLIECENGSLDRDSAFAVEFRAYAKKLYNRIGIYSDPAM